MIRLRMHQNERLGNVRLLQVFLIGVIFTGNVRSSNVDVCNVTGLERTHYNPIHSTAAFKYMCRDLNDTNSSVACKDLNCTYEDGLYIRLKTCQPDPTGATYSSPKFKEGDNAQCKRKEEWQAIVYKDWSPTEKKSPCFNCTGTKLKGNFIIYFRETSLKVTIKIYHPALESWNLTIYETKNVSNFFNCGGTYEKLVPRKLKSKRFDKIYSERYNYLEGRTEITVNNQTFDFDACYCFEFQPISKTNLTPRQYWHSTLNCKPLPDKTRNDTIIPNPGHVDTNILLTVGVIIVLVLITGLIIFILIKRGLFKGILRREMPNVRESVRLLPSHQVKMLLLHTRDTAKTRQLENLKKHLRSIFKVYDLYNCHTDVTWLSDSRGQVEELLKADSNVKIVLVESAGMITLINSLLQSPNPSAKEKLIEQSLQDTEVHKLLVFALTTVISTTLRHNYSSLYVVRFSDKMKDAVHLLVHMKRYKFPEHWTPLLQDMTHTGQC